MDRMVDEYVGGGGLMDGLQIRGHIKMLDSFSCVSAMLSTVRMVHFK